MHIPRTVLVSQLVSMYKVEIWHCRESDTWAPAQEVQGVDRPPIILYKWIADPLKFWTIKTISH